MKIFVFSLTVPLRTTRAFIAVEKKGKSFFMRARCYDMNLFINCFVYSKDSTWLGHLNVWVRYMICGAFDQLMIELAWGMALYVRYSDS